MRTIKSLAGALLGMLGYTSVPAPVTKESPPHVNPILNSIRFGGKFMPTGAPPASWSRRNQRKARKNFRRKIAAGY